MTVYMHSYGDANWSSGIFNIRTNRNKATPAMFVIGRTFLTQQQQCREFFLALVCESPWWFA